MKIYCIETRVYNKGFAVLRPSSDKIKNNVLQAIWDDWGSGGKYIGDFVFNFWYLTCKREVFDVLRLYFNELDSITVEIVKTKKEQDVKNSKYLKWLPIEVVDLVVLKTSKVKNALSKSSIIYNKKWEVVGIQGVAELRGDIIIPAKKDKGLIFSKEEIWDANIFKVNGFNNLLLCTEKVKQFCEEKDYENIIFLEYGKVI